MINFVAKIPSCCLYGVVKLIFDIVNVCNFKIEMCASLRRGALFHSQCAWRLSVVHIILCVASFGLQKSVSRLSAVHIPGSNVLGA